MQRLAQQDKNVVKITQNSIGGSKRGARDLSFSCSFRQKICKIIGQHTHFGSWRPPYENLGSATVIGYSRQRITPGNGTSHGGLQVKNLSGIPPPPQIWNFSWRTQGLRVKYYQESLYPRWIVQFFSKLPPKLTLLTFLCNLKWK